MLFKKPKSKKNVTCAISNVLSSCDWHLTFFLFTNNFAFKAVTQILVPWTLKQVLKVFLKARHLSVLVKVQNCAKCKIVVDSTNIIHLKQMECKSLKREL